MYAASAARKEKPILFYLKSEKTWVGVGAKFPRRPPKLPEFHPEATPAQYKKLFDLGVTGIEKKDNDSIRPATKKQRSRTQSAQSDTANGKGRKAAATNDK